MTTLSDLICSIASSRLENSSHSCDRTRTRRTAHTHTTHAHTHTRSRWSAVRSQECVFVECVEWYLCGVGGAFEEEAQAFVFGPALGQLPLSLAPLVGLPTSSSFAAAPLVRRSLLPP